MGPSSLDRQGRLPDEKTPGHEATQVLRSAPAPARKGVWKIRERCPSSSPSVPSVRQDRDAPLFCKGSGGDSGGGLRGTIYSTFTIGYTRKTASHDAQVERQVQEILTAPVPPLPGDYFVSPAETIKMIARLPKRNAPGPDAILTAAIRLLL
ncbi:hypothetical protein EVAR_66766_1 [Eumeta japonica]|uniref:Uncharacterized protein n=1 Tax=Eumeta variegata TaxID=151549 RepID=A0A4C1Z9D0_EUMVA|nr:hypothetical protein EVAR_66766_1 [Eumeta japonica]